MLQRFFFFLIPVIGSGSLFFRILVPFSRNLRFPGPVADSLVIPGSVSAWIAAAIAGLVLSLPFQYIFRESPEKKIVTLILSAPSLIALFSETSVPFPLRIMADSAPAWYVLVLVACALRFRLPEMNLHRRTGLFLTMGILLTWVVASTVLMKTTRYIRQEEPTGDETEYIMLARSLWTDHDMELAADEKLEVYREFMTGRFHLKGKSFRPPGFPLLLIPSYLPCRWFFHFPFPVYFFIGLLFTWAGCELFLLLDDLIRNPFQAFIVTLVAFFTPPLIYFSNQIYPEIIASAIILRVVRRDILTRRSRCSHFSWILISLLPWFHQKYLYFMAVLAFFLTLGAVQRRDKAGFLFILYPILSVSGLVTFFMFRIGIPLPTAPYSLGEILGKHLFEIRTLRTFTGQFFDQRWGLFLVSPVYFLIIPGFIRLFRQHRKLCMLIVLIFFPFLILISTYLMWWGGFSPPDRFMVPVLPLLWVPIAMLLPGIGKSTKLQLTVVLFVILSMTFSYLGLFAAPFEYQGCSPFLYPEESPHGSSQLAFLSRFADWTQLAPRLERGGKWLLILPKEERFGPRDVRIAAFWWICALLFGLWAAGAAGKSDPETALRFRIRNLGVWTGMILAGVWILYLFSGKTGSENLENRWLREDLHAGGFSRLHRYSLVNAKGVPQLLYGRKHTTWTKAWPGKNSIFYPAVYDQDYPQLFWPGGYTYQFTAPVVLIPSSRTKIVKLVIENRCTRTIKQDSRDCSKTSGEHLLKVNFSIPEDSQALFRVKLYGMGTDEYYFKNVFFDVFRMRSAKGTSIPLLEKKRSAQQDHSLRVN